METIDQGSVQRMCRNAIAIQQTLSSITASREVALDQARNYYEMLYMDPEVSIASKHQYTMHQIDEHVWNICRKFSRQLSKKVHSLLKCNI